jgi:hypothetical protein
MGPRLSCASRIYCAAADVGPESRSLRNHRAWLVGVGVAIPLALSSGSWESLGAEENPLPPAANHLEETNSQGLLHAFMQLQAQLQATQLAIEQNRQDAQEAAARNVAVLSNGLQTLQQTFSAQRAQDLETTQRTNKLMLILLGTFAGLGFLTMLIMTCLQWRMSEGLAEVTAALSTALGLGAGDATATLALAEESDLRPLGATGQSEQRPDEPAPIPQQAWRRRKWAGIETLIFPAPGDTFRRRQFRALKVAVLVGLLCAAVLALLLYVLTSRKVGPG